MSDLEDKAAALNRAYQLCFGSPAGQAVLADLDPYCFGLETTAVPGDRDQGLINEGRRQVLLRIQKFTNVNLKELFELRMGRTVLRNENGEKINE